LNKFFYRPKPKVSDGSSAVNRFRNE